jgi:hypothetical protein
MKRDEPGRLLFYHWNWQPTAADEKRWTKLFKSLGAANVRSRLNSATSFEPNELIDIGVDPPWPTREFVEQWLRKQEIAAQHREAIRFRCTFVVAFIAMVAACIAAWPSIFH